MHGQQQVSANHANVKSRQEAKRTAYSGSHAMQSAKSHSASFSFNSRGASIGQQNSHAGHHSSNLNAPKSGRLTAK